MHYFREVREATHQYGHLWKTSSVRIKTGWKILLLGMFLFLTSVTLLLFGSDIHIMALGLLALCALVLVLLALYILEQEKEKPQ